MVEVVECEDGLLGQSESAREGEQAGVTQTQGRGLRRFL